MKYVWTAGRQEVLKLEEVLAKDAVCHQTFSTYTVNTLPGKLLKSFETSKLKDK
jgi:predicted transcriptional regulator